MTFKLELELELELELIQTQMAQEPMLRAAVYARVQSGVTISPNLVHSTRLVELSFPVPPEVLEKSTEFAQLRPKAIFDEGVGN